MFLLLILLRLSTHALCHDGDKLLSKRSDVCYDDLGCFSTEPPFDNTPERPFTVLPQSPEQIGTIFGLFSRNNSDVGQDLEALKTNSVADTWTSYTPRLTKFIVHGFLQDPATAPWLRDMKDELLKKADYNVVIVDWHTGNVSPYSQATANTRVVGAQIAYLIQKLIENFPETNVADFHIIGHSLGAHIAGYAGERTPGLGRITGLDPAGPYFENTDPRVRLDPTDATFVDAIHTDDQSWTALAYGIKQQVGHLDFYPNLGHDQPGCTANLATSVFQPEAPISAADAVNIVICHHARAVQYFHESINSACPFLAYPCVNEEEYLSGKCKTCENGGCASMGLRAEQYKPLPGTRRSLYLTTSSAPPFCRSDVCYDDLGCFSTEPPFDNTPERPFTVLPQSPEQIGTIFGLFSRNNSDVGQDLEALKTNSVADTWTSYTPRLTKFIVHGFLQDPATAPWLRDMKDELLKKADYNVVIVDWHRGNGSPYSQATANTRVVGAQIAYLIQKLIENFPETNAADFHIIGHSLGAHIAGYAGERTPGLGRITGLDPAGPYFENTDPRVRLDPTDATFVDAIHTDDQSWTALAYGIKQPVGHLDFYPNLGHDQPGCTANLATSVFQLEAPISAADAVNIVICHHARAVQYFHESINSACPFLAYPCVNEEEYLSGECKTCENGGCAPMGFRAEQYKPLPGTRRSLYLTTSSAPPFCQYSYELALEISPVSGGNQLGYVDVILAGDNGRSPKVELNQFAQWYKAGGKYNLSVGIPNDLGNVGSVTLFWRSAFPILDLVLNTSLKVDSVVVYKADTGTRLSLCAGGEAISSQKSIVITDAC